FKAKVISALSLITFVVIWQLVCTFKLVSPMLLPSPLQIVDTVLDLFQNGYRYAPFYQHILVRTARAFFAFFIAIIIGVPLGLLMGR
ncbi:taurine ABC transporter permease, partial [Acinetobacter guillouiae]